MDQGMSTKQYRVVGPNNYNRLTFVLWEDDKTISCTFMTFDAKTKKCVNDSRFSIVEVE